MSSHSSSLPAASLIIPTRNREDLLLHTVESVLAGDVIPDEIIVVDQSDEPSAAMQALAAIHSESIRHLWTPEPGVSRARNLGIREAQHDVLVFIDDDMQVTQSWYESLVRALCTAGEHAAVTGRVLPEAISDGEGFVPSTIEDVDPQVYAGRIGTDILYSNNMALWRSTFDAVGLFDERLGGGSKYRTAEDNELAFRMLEAEYRIHYVPEAAVYHRAWRTMDDYLPLNWSYGFGQGAYYAKHSDLRDRYMLGRFAYDVRQRLKRGLQFGRRDPHRAIGQVVYLAGLISGGVHWLVSQPRSE
jgi:glycosyltransferase involved in cell wall biosynthesis